MVVMKMAKYTMTLEEIARERLSQNYMAAGHTYAELVNYMYTVSVDDIINTIKAYCFDKDYPFYTDDTAAKEQFETIFANTFVNIEIGFETQALWKLKLYAFLMTWMPYYKDIYNNYLTAIELKKQRDITTTYDGTGYSYNKGTNGNTNTHKGVTTNEQSTTNTAYDSDYPQATYSTEVDYATTSGYTKVGTSGNVKPDLTTIDDGKSTSNTDNGQKYKQVVSGYTGDAASLTKDYDDILHNINQELIDKARQYLFMKLW